MPYDSIASCQASDRDVSSDLVFWVLSPWDLNMRVIPVLLLLFFSSFPAVLRAQSTNGSISGRVTDPSKAVIADAKVAAVNAGTNVRNEGATNDSGGYY